MNITRNRYYLRCKALFTDFNSGKKFKLTAGQIKIFKAIYDPTILRAVIKTTTQYGKSEVASLALICTAISRPEKILIIAPSQKQASIIMGKVIDHLFDHPLLTSMIETSGSSLENLKNERSKNRITFKNGSEIRMLTAEANNVSKEAKNLMGFGASLVLVDESALITDSMFAKILRMVGGVENGKLVQLSNPFDNNHFGRAFDDPRYYKISIDYRQALAEGRLKQEFLNEAREMMSELDSDYSREI